jgi:hypothetical protein
MSVLGLNLPTDIPWEQMCVTEDMMAPVACEVAHPPKWRSSAAVARYVPEDAYQIYPGRRITYLKVTCSLAGYQPRDKEVEGLVSFGDAHKQTIDNLDSLLDTYLPCTGALIQVTVSPPARSGVRLDAYPYFMDFQPQTRELYEMVTETGERASRSLEDLHVGKASGTTQSLEVLDIDQGGSSGGSAGVSVLGTGVSGSYSESTSGQWGTKQLGAAESSVSRSSDESRERRETESHTTQLSQMYHLLDSYHKGTNRAVFFVQPRPHVLEIPTGFVRGPRGIDGVQEFFLVVSQPADAKGFEVSVRVDTSHLAVVPVMDYDRSRSGTVECTADAMIPTAGDPPAPPETAELVDGDGDHAGTIYYNCYKREDHQSTPYAPPDGYRIDTDTDGGYLDQVNDAQHGDSSVDVDPGGNSLTVYCNASSHVCKYDHHDVDFGWKAPDNVQDDSDKWSGYARRSILVHLISREQTQKVGEKNVLVVTARELCCGDRTGSEQGVVDVLSLVDASGASLSLTPRRFTAATTLPARLEGAAQPPPPPPADRPPVLQGETGGGEGLRAVAREPGTMTAREANELSDTIREAMVQSAGSRRREDAAPVPYIHTDLFALQLRRKQVQSSVGRAILARGIGEVASRQVAASLNRALGGARGHVSCGTVAALPSDQLASLAGITVDQARDLRLACLGLPMKARRARPAK